MSKHAKPTLVHIWTSDTENPLNLLVNDWFESGHYARFTIPRDIGKSIFGLVHKATVRAVVLSSEEIEWHIEAMHARDYMPALMVECTSRRAWRERATLTDEWFLLNHESIGLSLANPEAIR